MDENEHLKESLKRKEKIKEYRIASRSSKIAGVVFFIIGCLYFHFFPAPSLYVPLRAVIFFAVLTGLIALNAWAKLKAGYLERELGAYDKGRERRRAQQPVHPATAEPGAQLQYCPSCSKMLQPDWNVCAYCGKRLKKSG